MKELKFFTFYETVLKKSIRDYILNKKNFVTFGFHDVAKYFRLLGSHISVSGIYLIDAVVYGRMKKMGIMD